jgi:hypothetical protein
MNIDRYAVLRDKDASLGEVDHLYDTLDEARAAAEPGNAIVELHFVFEDSELVEVTR